MNMCIWQAIMNKTAIGASTDFSGVCTVGNCWSQAVHMPSFS